MLEVARRILVWLFEQDSALGETGMYSTRKIQEGLGLSEHECQVALETLWDKYVKGSYGDARYNRVSLTGKGCEWAEEEQRRFRLARNLFEQGKAEAARKRDENKALARRAFASQNTLRSTMFWDKMVDIERQYVMNVVAARMGAETQARSLTPDNAIIKDVERLVRGEVEDANARLSAAASKGLPDTFKVDLQALLQEALRVTQIRLDERALAPESASPHWAEVRSLIDAILTTLQSMNLNPSEREATVETLNGAKKETEKSKPRADHIRRALERLPDTVKTTAAFLKIAEFISKIGGGPDL